VGEGPAAFTEPTEMPKLFVEYVGMGDSDKPKDYPWFHRRTD